MENFMDVYNDYETFARKSFKESAIMRSLLSSGRLIADDAISRNLKINPINRVSSRTTRLQRSNVRGESIRDIDKGLNTFLETTKESGGRPTGDLFSRYADAVTKAGVADATLNNQIMMQEAGMNLQSMSQADQINANIDSQNAGAENQLALQKAGMKQASLGMFDQGIMSMLNGRSQLESVLATSKAQAMYDDISLNITDENLLTKRNATNPPITAIPESRVPAVDNSIGTMNVPDIKINKDIYNTNFGVLEGNFGLRDGFNIGDKPGLYNFNPFVPYKAAPKASSSFQNGPIVNGNFAALASGTMFSNQKFARVRKIK